MSAPEALQEIECIEDDDTHHDFGGGHGSKGHDFAHFWLIVRTLEAEEAGFEDYMFVCEYVQDIAEFNSSTVPATVVLYQLKKKEDGYWSASDLTGQTEKSKSPKVSKPLTKLHKSVRAFKSIKSRGVFVSNAKFKVDLASKESSVNSTSVSLSDWDEVHREALRKGFSKLEGVSPSEIDLSCLELRQVALHVDDLQRHTNGVMLDFLQRVAPDHINQASSLVDTIYVRVKATARRTSKCKSWSDLIKQRGFGKRDFIRAVESLSDLPDKAGSRQRLFEKLARNWSSRRADRVLAALTRCAREKILVGTANRWHFDCDVVGSACEYAEANDQGDKECFEAVMTALAGQLPELSQDELSALAIYEMTEWNLNQIPA